MVTDVPAVLGPASKMASKSLVGGKTSHVARKRVTVLQTRRPSGVIVRRTGFPDLDFLIAIAFLYKKSQI